MPRRRVGFEGFRRDGWEGQGLPSPQLGSRLGPGSVRGPGDTAGTTARSLACPGSVSFRAGLQRHEFGVVDLPVLLELVEHAFDIRRLALQNEQFQAFSALLFAVEVGVDAPLITVLQPRHNLFRFLVMGGDEYAADLTD